MIINDRLKELRKNSGLTQKQLAERIGVAKSVVSYYESGDRLPSYDVLKKLARTFHVTTDYLLGIEYSRTLDVSDLSDDQIMAITDLIETMK